MDQIALMAVFHPLYDLPEEYLRSFLVQLPLLLHILEQLSTLQKFHDDGDLHVLECEAVVYFDDVLMVEGLEYFCLNEDIVDIAN